MGSGLFRPWRSGVPLVPVAHPHGNELACDSGGGITNRSGGARSRTEGPGPAGRPSPDANGYGLERPRPQGRCSSDAPEGRRNRDRVGRLGDGSGFNDLAGGLADDTAGRRGPPPAPGLDITSSRPIDAGGTVAATGLSPRPRPEIPRPARRTRPTNQIEQVGGGKLLRDGRDPSRPSSRVVDDFPPGRPGLERTWIRTGVRFRWRTTGFPSAHDAKGRPGSVPTVNPLRRLVPGSSRAQVPRQPGAPEFEYLATNFERARLRLNRAVDAPGLPGADLWGSGQADPPFPSISSMGSGGWWRLGSAVHSPGRIARERPLRLAVLDDRASRVSIGNPQ